MSTPLWKKRLILMVGLLENLVFSGTILGWPAMNYMLKSEGVYQYICDDINHQIQYKNISFTNLREKLSFDNNSDINNNKFIKSLKNLNIEFIDLIVDTTPVSGLNKTILEELEAYNMKQSFIADQRFNAQGCVAQDKILNLAYTVGGFSMGFSAFIWGFLLEKWGLKVVRLLISCLITGGTILLCITNSERPLLIFPAVILLSLGGVPLRIANMQFANLYPSKRSTIISLYSGAFCASAVVFVVLKYLFDFGMSYFLVTLLLALTSLLMFPFTLFILPSDRIKEESEESDDKTTSVFKRNAYRSSLAIISPKVILKKFTQNSSPYFARKSFNYNKQKETPIKSKDEFNIDLNYHTFSYINPIFWVKEQTNTINTIAVSPHKTVTTKTVIPLKISLWSLAFNLHQWWFSWMITYMVMYGGGSLNLWLQRVTTDSETADNFSKVYGCAQVLCLLIAPIAGLLIDSIVQKADKETDPFERKLMRVRAGFWPLFITTLFLSACLLCRFFDNDLAIYLSIVFMTIFRAFLVGVGTAYLRIRFNGEHFNRLLGIMSTVASVVSLLQFPLFLWESQYPKSAIWVNVFNCFCTLIAFSNPIYILITPLQRYLLHKEEREEADAKSK